MIDVVSERITMLQILEFGKLMIMRISSIKNLGVETKLLDDNWYYLEALNQIVT